MRGNFIIVRCNKCGRRADFCPESVVLLNPCECGNNDYGGSKWAEDNFGQFTAISSYNLKMPDYSDYLKKEKLTHWLKRKINLLFGISLSCWFDDKIYRRIWLIKARRG